MKKFSCIEIRYLFFSKDISFGSSLGNQFKCYEDLVDARRDFHIISLVFYKN